jgi:hypothetical protein
MFNQPIRTSAAYDYTTPVYFFLCFDFSFEVNRYLVLFGVSLLYFIAVVAVL